MFAAFFARLAKPRRFDKDACWRLCYFGRPLFWDCTMAKREQTVLVLQGGGALGAYQEGVYEGIAETGLDLNWIAGVSRAPQCWRRRRTQRQLGVLRQSGFNARTGACDGVRVFDLAG
jgi:hypothetical protein